MKIPLPIVVFFLYSSCVPLFGANCPAGDTEWWRQTAKGDDSEYSCLEAIQPANDRFAPEQARIVDACTNQGGNLVPGTVIYNAGTPIQTSSASGANQCSGGPYFTFSISQESTCCGSAPNPNAVKPPSIASDIPQDHCKFEFGANWEPQWYNVWTTQGHGTGPTCENVGPDGFRSAKFQSEQSYLSNLNSMHEECVRQGGSTAEIVSINFTNCTHSYEHLRYGKFVCCKQSGSIIPQAPVPSAPSPIVAPPSTGTALFGPQPTSSSSKPSISSAPAPSSLQAVPEDPQQASLTPSEISAGEGMVLNPLDESFMIQEVSEPTYCVEPDDAN